MKLYNTLTSQKEPFPTTDGKVGMYVCGITPYASSHIGHAMFTVVFDVVRRYLEFKGFDVRHVQNFTDIDDKMIRAATEAGVSTTELAERNMEEYLRQMDALNVLRAHVYPKATEEIGGIVEMIEVLVAKEAAYPVDGDVYYRVRNKSDYGKLSHRDLDGMMAGARVEVDERKEDAMDFALWKASKPGEPSWDSPWGPGRPGWHIECSAMSMAHLDGSVDIHGGGRELIFPHHENELAQTESYSDGRSSVRFWLHNGLLEFGHHKMSKSLGNVVSVDEALDRFSPDALRLFFLSSHYRSPLVYDEGNIEAQERAAERLRHGAKGDGESGGVAPPVAPDSFRERFVEAMDDDLNTPQALASLFDLAREVNRARDEGRDVVDAQSVLTELAEVLGLTLEEPNPQAKQDIAPYVDLLVETRSELRKARQYDLADQIRLKLEDLGVTLEDTPRGTEWKARRR